jgi:hypothetical protein
LFKIVGEEFARAGLPCSDEILSLARGRVLNNKVWYTPERGSGLGNMNEVITFCQCIIADILKERGRIKDAMIFNDDSVYVPTSDNNHPLVVISSEIQAFGILVNFEKSFESKYTVYCEDYTPGIGFDKLQLDFLSIASIFRGTEIWQFKEIYRNVKSHLLRKGIDFSFSNLPYEHHMFERVLPVELGGYLVLQKYNTSLILDYIDRPNDYLQSFNDRGLFPLVKSFLNYLRVRKDEFINAFYVREHIKYRERIKNPFNPSFLDPELYFCDHDFPLFRPEQWNQFERLYNTRGLKNAKPKILINSARYTAKLRKEFFRNFWRAKDELFGGSVRDFNSLYYFLDLIKQSDQASTLIPPRWIGEGVRGYVQSTNKYYFYVRHRHVTEQDPSRILQSWKSLTDKKCLLNCSILPLVDLIDNVRETPLISHEKKVRMTYGLPVPDYYSLFCRDKRYFASCFYSVYGYYPVSFKAGLSSPDILKYRKSIPEMFIQGSSKFLSQIRTEKERSIFYMLTQDIPLTLSIIREAVEAVKIIISDINRNRNANSYIRDPFIPDIHDNSMFELMQQEFPELVTDLLLDEELYLDDYPDQDVYDSDEELDRIDIIDLSDSEYISD